MAYPPPNHYLSDLGLALMPGDGESRVAIAIEPALCAATRSPLSGLAVRYRSLGRRGPFRTAIETLPGKLATLVRARVRDDGAEGALVAVATGRLAPR